jgi:hypothetical protein
MKHSPALAALIEALRTLPGVGPKSAQRMAFHLLQNGRVSARALANAIPPGCAPTGMVAIIVYVLLSEVEITETVLSYWFAT